jgi:Lon protease-like protein
MRWIRRFDDGRMDLSTVGFRRFEIQDLDEGRSYLRGRVEFFDDESGERAEEEFIRKAIRGYYAMRALDGPEPPEETRVLNDPQLSFQLAQAVTDLNVPADVADVAERGGADPAAGRALSGDGGAGAPD